MYVAARVARCAALTLHLTFTLPGSARPAPAAGAYGAGARPSRT